MAKGESNELAQLREANAAWAAQHDRDRARIAELEQQLAEAQAQQQVRWPSHAVDDAQGTRHRVRAPNPKAAIAAIAAKLGASESDLRWRGYTQA